MNNYNYEIKLPYYKDIDLYDLSYIESFIKDLFNRYINKFDINTSISIDIYINEIYGMIINICDELVDDDRVKLVVHMDSYFLYEIEYFDIPLQLRNKNKIYYYNDKFYLLLESIYKNKEYFKIIEFSNIIYGNDSLNIVNEGLKI